MATLIELETPKLNRTSRTSLAPLGRNISFAVVNLHVIANKRPDVLETILTKVMDLISSQSVKLRDPSVMPTGCIDVAFNAIQSAEHTGKLVLDADYGSEVEVLTPPSSLKGTFVIAGGPGSLGRRLCTFLTNTGVTHIVILTRRCLDPITQKALELQLGVERRMWRS